MSTGADPARLFSPGSIGGVLHRFSMLRHAALYSNTPLRALIECSYPDSLLAAVGREAARVRALFRQVLLVSGELAGLARRC